MNVYCIVMFEFNYSFGGIRNSDLGEGIICSGEGSGGKGGGKWGKRGREVGVRGEESGECLPPCPPPPSWYCQFHEQGACCTQIYSKFCYVNVLT